MKDFLNKARDEHFAIGAFNLDSFETLKAVAAASLKLDSPVLAEVSPGEVDFLGLANIASLIDNTKRSLGVPLFLNLDHADNLDNIEKALDFGFDLIHFDGGKLPLEENIAKAKQVVSWAHAKNIPVEGEMDHIFKAEENQERLTDPLLASRFVTETGVDIFAVSIGNNHGISEHEGIDLELLGKIREVLPNTFFSLHGGSGIPAEQIKGAIEMGVVKININSELRLAFKNNLDLTNPELAWYKLVQKSTEEVQKVVENKILMFGSDNKSL